MLEELCVCRTLRSYQGALGFSSATWVMLAVEPCLGVLVRRPADTMLGIFGIEFSAALFEGE